MDAKTPFYEKILQAGGRMVPFAGYSMPMQFEGIIPEHTKVRQSVGVFDVSHMGRVEVKGPQALEFLEHLVTNHVSKLQMFQAVYTVMCYPEGGIVDDLLIYRLPEHYLVVVNANNNAKDQAWMREQAEGYDVEIIDRTADIGQLAVQGPRAEDVLSKLTETNLSEIGFYQGIQTELAGVEMFISRTGYTGEDGFELYIPAAHAEAVWDKVFEAGKEEGIAPIGLGARDTLRLEMKYALYGNDIDKTTNPIEAGLSWVVKLDKPRFVGKEALEKVKEKKPSRRLVCLEVKDKGIPRPHDLIMTEGEELGHVTSGTFSPSLQKGIALGYVRRGHTKSGTELKIRTRRGEIPVEVVKPPFYKNASHK
ncbi:glycine cleavage system aminomethyltransferase GcvT [candidate division WOR-3 bacterium]|uniref:Aminomethyltransferase n=1 Tax=candidate division WOR-3 bacterium TaxID=2052148 RepID=A0A9D5K877_UNCW3|nr:glycine cleavage system aminomethyltransferase GcvT [candidate division WOR-3 bacterium]MBD3364216.1 glycine cleavage system aminomethyltransferase GcvT [candidate division WOR-3 bacterium]